MWSVRLSGDGGIALVLHMIDDEGDESAFRIEFEDLDALLDHLSAVQKAAILTAYGVQVGTA